MSTQIDNQRIKTAFDFATRVVTFEGDGKALAIDLDSLSLDIRLYALAQGIIKKVGDGAAIGRDPETGKPATMERKWAALEAIAERISGPNGQWNADPKRAAQLRKEAQERQEWQATLMALCAIKYATLESVEGRKLVAWAEAKGRDAVVTLRNAKPEFMAEYIKALASLKATSASQEGQVDSLLDELDAL